MSWHRYCRGRCIGRVLHFLYHYCGFDVAENAQIGYDNVLYHGKTIANYEYLSDTDIPYFTFKEYKYYSGHDLSIDWVKNQKEKFHEAIKDADDTKPEPCNECRSLKLKLSIYEDASKFRSK